MRLKKAILPVAVLAACLTATHAVQLQIVNENKKEIKIKIEPEGDTATAFTQTIPADYNSTLTLDVKQFSGKSYFSIKGDTSAFTPGGKCEHLSVDKDYKVTFQNNDIGTTCVAEELPVSAAK
ncbi:MAG: hypothetical protein K0R52_1440 [Alphaproteobacteria bacterium]|jgi:hypothetical protein|nr:hypothetical protein [Alphaproteobacteria bacterium]